MSETRTRLSVIEKVGYGLGDTAANLVWRTLMVFLPFFYTDVFGLSAAAVGTLLLVCRYWDGITDLVMGVIADRTTTRWGKFRPWILWTALPFGVMTVLTFTTFDLSPTGKLVYAYLTYGGLVLVYTANNIPYSAMTGVMTADGVERTSISSYRFIFAFLGGLITQGLSLPLVAYFGGGSDIVGYQYTMTVFATASVVLFLVTFLTTRERLQPVPESTTTLRKDLRDLFQNRPWLIMFGVGLLFVTFETLRQGSTMFYFKYYVQDIGLAPVFMVVGLLAAMAGAAVTTPLTARLGKKRVLHICFIVAAIASGLLYIAAPEDIALIFVLSMIFEFAGGPIVTLFFAMLADTSDYSEWKNGRRATGLIFSAGSVSMKMGTGVAGALTGWILTLVGYRANELQSALAMEGIRILMSLAPAFFALIGYALFRSYPLDDRRLSEIQSELAQKRAGTAT